jgi:guanine deaminase
MSMQAYRASLLRFEGDATLFDTDGLLVVSDGRVAYAGAWADAPERFVQAPAQHWPGHIIAPGFIDLHLHYPQVDVIGSPADGLLPWLTNYTFPEEKRFAAPEYSAQVAQFFIAQLLHHGVTTASVFCTSHPSSVDALMQEAQAHKLRLVAGKCLMDRHAPDGLRDHTEQSLLDTEALIQRWHGKGRLGYAITPRFAPTSTEAQLRGAGELAAKYPNVWVQSHVAENLEEIAWACELFPASRSYLGVYDDFGLLRSRSLYAHGIHFDAADWHLMHERGAAVAVCPTSNLFLGSGFFDFASAQGAQVLHGLASDIGGGTSLSPFHTMLAAYYVGRTSAQVGATAKAALSLTPQKLWWLHTAGAAQAMGLGAQVGSLATGSEADFVRLNPQATPLLARRTARAQSLDELLFAMIVLGDERVIEQTYVLGEPTQKLLNS